MRRHVFAYLRREVSQGSVRCETSRSLLPVRCVVCAASGEELCAGCREGLPLLDRLFASGVGRRPRGPCAAAASAPAVASRSPPRARRSSTTPAFGASSRAGRSAVFGGCRPRRRTCRRERRAPLRRHADLVPPDRERVLERGHHPAERLARELGERWELPVAPLLARTRAVPHQRGLSLAERRRNVTGAFSPCRESPPAWPSSTTSTRAAPPRTPRRRRSGTAVRAGSRS